MRCLPIAAALFAAMPATAQTPTFTVSTPTQLAALLPQLTQASIVLLAPGNYGEMFVRNLRPSGEVVFRSANPANPAVFRTLFLRDSSNVRLDGLVFNRPRAPGEADTVNALMIRDSSRIAVTGSRFFSNLNNDPMDDGYLMRIMNSEDVVVLDSDFRDGHVAILSDWSRGVLVASSRFQDLREGINFAGGERLRVERSYFTRLSPNLDAKDHTDCVQVFQLRDASPARQVQVTNNVMIPVNPLSQGIFIRNSLDPSRRHEGVRVVNNLYFGGARQGISVQNADRAFVSRNSVLSAPVITRAPGMSLVGSTNVQFQRNITAVLSTTGAQLEQSGVVMLAWDKFPGADQQAQFVGSLAQAVPAIAHFSIAPGSAAAAANAGFTPVSEIGDIPDAQRESRYAWYRLHLGALTTVANAAQESDQPLEPPAARLPGGLKAQLPAAVAGGTQSRAAAMSATVSGR